MKKLLLIILFVAPVLVYAQDTEKEGQLKMLAARMLADESGMHSWSTLKPAMEDFQSIFKTVEDVGEIWMYTEPEYMDLLAKVIQINPEYTEIEIKSAIAAELAPDLTLGFPDGYGQISNRIKQNVRLYMITFSSTDKKNKGEQVVDIFFHVNGKWVFIPKAYQAFE